MLMKKGAGAVKLGAWMLAPLLWLSCSSQNNSNNPDGGNPNNPGNNPGNQFPNGEIPSELKYFVAEASGEWKLEFAQSHGGAMSRSTSIVRMSKTNVENPLGQDALYLPSAGLLQITPALHYTSLPIDGTETRAGKTTPCRGGPGASTKEEDDQIGLRFNITPERYVPAIPYADLEPLSPPPGFAFVAFHRARYPKACNDVPYDLETTDLIERSRRTNPISVAQLLAGGFVVEGSGSAPIHSPPADDTGEGQGVSGTLTWTYRIVFRASTYNAQSQPGSPAVAIDTSGDACAGSSDIFTSDSLEMAEAAQLAGETIYPVTPGKCRRVRRQQNGNQKTIEILDTVGTRFVFDEPSRTLRGERDERLIQRWTEEPGKIFREIDENLDGKFDAVVTILYGRTGGFVSSERIELDPLTGVNHLRATTTPVGTDRVQVVQEEYVNGAWSAFEQFETPRMQLRCFKPKAPMPGADCNATYKPCTKAQKRIITDRLSEARDRIAKNCGLKHPTIQAQANEVFGLVEANKVNFFCTTAPCADFGGFDPDAKEDGTHDMQINITRMAANARSGQATLYHELLHSQIRHNDDMEKLAGDAGKLPVVDSVYACENLCFSDVVTKCDCNRCMAKKAKSPTPEMCKECAGYKECPSKTDSSGELVSSEVAAYCNRGRGILCDTKDECDAECVVAQCIPYKASCRSNCN